MVIASDTDNIAEAQQADIGQEHLAREQIWVRTSMYAFVWECECVCACVCLNGNIWSMNNFGAKYFFSFFFSN